MLYARYSHKLYALMRATDIWSLGRVDALLSAYSEAQSGCPVTHSYTRRGVERLFSAPCWQILSIERAHIFKYDIPAYIGKVFIVIVSTTTTTTTCLFFCTYFCLLMT